MADRARIALAKISSAEPMGPDMNVLLVGTIEPSLVKTVEAKYKALQLPHDAARSAFLARHGASITAIVDGGPPGVDADPPRGRQRITPPTDEPGTVPA